MATRLIEIELRVRDLDACERFYREVVGTPLERDVHGPGDELHYHAAWGSWAAGGEPFLMLSLYHAAPGEETRARIGLAVDELASAHERAQRAGVDVVEPPARKPWGTQGTYRDPAGNLVSLVERPKAT